ncbi:thiamine phosphate synthase [Candidatus Berkiella cookevillensis]|uniref:Thiamine-phosphate synthase n=1 Tax=Candidatus Berkiella cookevillensis TaxID=437022 RepID=A0A0Q9YGC0_9GAMM|nr:thiamine phosphate synthase [Candidatus Berkiella cookevillensis]MCS5707596.1 thiamine phosphate synthase [Candidatus Berkiella cookevillensis]
MNKEINKNFYKLMLVTHRQDCPLEQYLIFIKRCVAFGITTVQLREKNASHRFLIEFAARLKEILDPLNIPLIINDRLDVALASNACGVHLGQSDGSVLHARAMLGAHKIIGTSINSIERLKAANDLPIDYIGMGAIFRTKTKHNVVRHWGAQGLNQAAKLARHPIVAIGGITTKNVADVLKNGANGIAVISAIHDASDAREVTQQLRKSIDLRCDGK